MVREFCRSDSTGATAGRNYRLLSIQRLICVAICLLFSGGLLAATAATLPTGFVETQIASGLSSPTAMDFAPDGRIFVCLQGGNLRVVKNGALLPTPFLTLTVDSSGERGLLGVAFDPSFATNNFVYVYYTVPGSPAHNRVSRFTANGDVAVAGSEVVLLNLDNLSSATNHNGGAIHFGPDGKLYVAVGENANGANSQTLTNLLGKVLRINSDGTIPTDNPFFNTAGARKEIWALGLRNPFTFAFQPGTGRLFINDVGQSTWEEINDGIAGSNYGWPTTEGPTSDPNFRSPLFAYGHGSSSTTGCAIVGGGFYNPSVVQFPASYVGKYFFADLCTGWIRLFDPSNNTAADFARGIQPGGFESCSGRQPLLSVDRISRRLQGSILRHRAEYHNPPIESDSHARTAGDLHGSRDWQHATQLSMAAQPDQYLRRECVELHDCCYSFRR